MPSTPPIPPKIPTGREIYDAIMGHIEPELTTEGIKKIAETYKNESPENQVARMKRYDVAFERYDEAHGGYIAMLEQQVNRYRRQSFARAEEEDRTEESGFLRNVDHTLLKAA